MAQFGIQNENSTQGQDCWPLPPELTEDALPTRIPSAGNPWISHFAIKSRKDTALLPASDARATLAKFQKAIESCPIMRLYFDAKHFDQLATDLPIAESCLRTVAGKTVQVLQLPDRSLSGVGFHIFSTMQVTATAVEEVIVGYGIYQKTGDTGECNIEFAFNILPERRKELGNLTDGIFLSSLAILNNQFKPLSFTTEPERFRSAVGDPLYVGIFYLKKGFIPLGDKSAGLEMLSELQAGNQVERETFECFWSSTLGRKWQLDLNAE